LFKSAQLIIIDRACKVGVETAEKQVMIEALLFDLDGTLANTDPIHFQTWKEILQDYGFELDRPLYDARFSGRLNIAIVHEWMPHLSPEAAEEFSQRKEAQFRDRAVHILTPLAGLLDILAWADQQGLKKAVVTNAPIENASFMLQVLKLADRFDTVVIGDELPRGKPDPLPYQTALNRLNVAPEAAIAFEDSPSGIRSAIAAGIFTIGMTTTQPAEVLYQLGVNLAIADFADPQLVDLLRSRRSSSIVS
jgi:HAD superfamily hydrolase (TIGR01509 family)